LRHLKSGRKFGRSSAHRQAMARNLSTALIRHGRIETTEAKAKELRRHVERLITRAKAGDLAARRHAAGYINEGEALETLFDTLVPRYATREGGYTRLYHIANRQGDNAPMVIMELVE
jgi:large subunit ribosomal protein L17